MPIFARKNSGDEDVVARHARNVFYGLGIALVLLALFMDSPAAPAQWTHPLAAKICAGMGAAVLAVGRFGSDVLRPPLPPPRYGLVLAAGAFASALAVSGAAGFRTSTRASRCSATWSRFSPGG